MQAYHGGIDTNNYMESMNRVFKKKWLNDRPDQRLDSLLHVYVFQITPYYYRMHVLAQMNSIR